MNMMMGWTNDKFTEPQIYYILRLMSIGLYENIHAPQEAFLWRMDIYGIRNKIDSYYFERRA